MPLATTRGKQPSGQEGQEKRGKAAGRYEESHNSSLLTRRERGRRSAARSGKRGGPAGGRTGSSAPKVAIQKGNGSAKGSQGPVTMRREVSYGRNLQLVLAMLATQALARSASASREFNTSDYIGSKQPDGSMAVLQPGSSGPQTVFSGDPIIQALANATSQQSGSDSFRFADSTVSFNASVTVGSTDRQYRYTIGGLKENRFGNYEIDPDFHDVRFRNTYPDINFPIAAVKVEDEAGQVLDYDDAHRAIKGLGRALKDIDIEAVIPPGGELATQLSDQSIVLADGASVSSGARGNDYKVANGDVAIEARYGKSATLIDDDCFEHKLSNGTIMKAVDGEGEEISGSYYQESQSQSPLSRMVKLSIATDGSGASDLVLESSPSVRAHLPSFVHGGMSNFGVTSPVARQNTISGVDAVVNAGQGNQFQAVNYFSSGVRVRNIDIFDPLNPQLEKEFTVQLSGRSVLINSVSSHVVPGPSFGTGILALEFFDRGRRQYGTIPISELSGSSGTVQVSPGSYRFSNMVNSAGEFKTYNLDDGSIVYSLGRFRGSGYLQIAGDGTVTTLSDSQGTDLVAGIDPVMISSNSFTTSQGVVVSRSGTGNVVANLPSATLKHASNVTLRNKEVLAGVDSATIFESGNYEVVNSDDHNVILSYANDDALANSICTIRSGVGNGEFECYVVARSKANPLNYAGSQGFDNFIKTDGKVKVDPLTFDASEYLDSDHYIVMNPVGTSSLVVFDTFLSDGLGQCQQASYATTEATTTTDPATQTTTTTTITTTTNPTTSTQTTTTTTITTAAGSTTPTTSETTTVTNTPTSTQTTTKSTTASETGTTTQTTSETTTDTTTGTSTGTTTKTITSVGSTTPTTSETTTVTNTPTSTQTTTKSTTASETGTSTQTTSESITDKTTDTTSRTTTETTTAAGSTTPTTSKTTTVTNTPTSTQTTTKSTTASETGTSTQTTSESTTDKTTDTTSRTTTETTTAAGSTTPTTSKTTTDYITPESTVTTTATSTASSTPSSTGSTSYTTTVTSTQTSTQGTSPTTSATTSPTTTQTFTSNTTPTTTMSSSGTTTVTISPTTTVSATPTSTGTTTPTSSITTTSTDTTTGTTTATTTKATTDTTTGTTTQQSTITTTPTDSPSTTETTTVTTTPTSSASTSQASTYTSTVTSTVSSSDTTTPTATHTSTATSTPTLTVTHTGTTTGTTTPTTTLSSTNSITGTTSQTVTGTTTPSTTASTSATSSMRSTLTTTQTASDTTTVTSTKTVSDTTTPSTTQTTTVTTTPTSSRSTTPTTSETITVATTPTTTDSSTLTSTITKSGSRTPTTTQTTTGTSTPTTSVTSTPEGINVEVNDNRATIAAWVVGVSVGLLAMVGAAVAVQKQRRKNRVAHHDPHAGARDIPVHQLEAGGNIVAAAGREVAETNIDAARREGMITPPPEDGQVGGVNEALYEVIPGGGMKDDGASHEYMEVHPDSASQDGDLTSSDGPELPERRQLPPPSTFPTSVVGDEEGQLDASPQDVRSSKGGGDVLYGSTSEPPKPPVPGQLPPQSSTAVGDGEIYDVPQGTGAAGTDVEALYATVQKRENRVQSVPTESGDEFDIATDALARSASSKDGAIAVATDVPEVLASGEKSSAAAASPFPPRAYTGRDGAEAPSDSASTDSSPTPTLEEVLQSREGRRKIPKRPGRDLKRDGSGGADSSLVRVSEATRGDFVNVVKRSNSPPSVRNGRRAPNLRSPIEGSEELTRGPAPLPPGMIPPGAADEHVKGPKARTRKIGNDSPVMPVPTRLQQGASSEAVEPAKVKTAWEKRPVRRRSDPTSQSASSGAELPKKRPDGKRIAVRSEMLPPQGGNRQGVAPPRPFNAPSGTPPQARGRGGVRQRIPFTAPLGTPPRGRGRGGRSLPPRGGRGSGRQGMLPGQSTIPITRLGDPTMSAPMTPSGSKFPIFTRPEIPAAAKRDAFPQSRKEASAAEGGKVPFGGVQVLPRRPQSAEGGNRTPHPPSMPRPQSAGGSSGASGEARPLFPRPATATTPQAGSDQRVKSVKGARSGETRL